MDYFLLLLFSFILSIILIPFLKKLGIKYHFCDEPGEDRLKIHSKPIPYLGGVGIFLVVVIFLIIAGFLNKISGYQIIGITLGGGIIILLGLWDDFKLKKGKPRPLLKLFGQSLSAFLVFFILVKIGINIHFSINQILIVLLGIFYLIGAMNAMNMEDGIDGLAGGLAITSLIGFTILSLIMMNSLALLFSLILIGAIGGFLVYNLHPASIFMGDNGSHFLGFCLVVLAIIFTSHPVFNFKQFIGPILIIGLPVVDAAWAIFRRLAKRKSPFQGDRSHLYDRLHQKGLSIKKTVLLCYGIQIIIVGVGVIIYLA